MKSLYFLVAAAILFSLGEAKKYKEMSEMDPNIALLVKDHVEDSDHRIYNSGTGTKEDVCLTISDLHYMVERLRTMREQCPQCVHH